MTSKNIILGFNCTGIFPFGRDIFINSDCIPSFETDRLYPNPGNDVSESGVETRPVYQEEQVQERNLQQDTHNSVYVSITTLH